MALSELKSKLNKLSTTDYFADDNATGFTKDFKSGTSTQFKTFHSRRGRTNYFAGDYSNGFRLNFNGKNTDFRIGAIYQSDMLSTYNFFDVNFKVNDGFKTNFKLKDSQYKNVQGKNFTWPLDLKRVDYYGNNLSPISDFDRQFPNMVGGLSSIMQFPESTLRKKFLYSTDQEAIKFGYKNRYEFKKENQIRLDSNSTKHPLILQSLMDVNRYGWAKNRFSNVGHTTDFVRGGIVTHLGTALTDQVRLTKFLTSGDGLWWLGKQFVLQYLNPRKETQLYNPLHINASIIPFLNVSRFINLADSSKGAAALMGFAKGGKGLYERTDGYDDFGIKDYREYTNKLAQYTRDRFDEDPPPKPIEEIVAVGKKAIRKAAAKAIFSKLGDQLNELAGKFRAESKPAEDVDSRKHQHGGFISEDRWTARKKTDYKTLSYDMLGEGNKYSNRLASAGELADLNELQSVAGLSQSTDRLKRSVAMNGTKVTDSRKIKSMGDASTPTKLEAFGDDDYPSHITRTLGGVTKKGTVGYHGDKVSILPYGDTESSDDLVKFQFKDMVNNKFIVFRATVSGLTDSISPDWGSEQYIGRADSVHVYKGAERSLSFGFTIAPTTKQELFTLWEKLNYLTGLNYPKYTNSKMVAPWVEFTFGDMYKGVPGFIQNLSYSIPDNAPYEIDGIQLPKVIEATMGFKYVGNNLQTMQGKHFDLPWLEYTDQEKLTTMERIEMEPVNNKKQYHYTGRPNRGGGVSEALQDVGMPNQYKPPPPQVTTPVPQAEVDNPPSN